MTLERSEKRFLVWLISAMVLVTSAPYVFGWLATPAGRTYTGIHRLTPGDIPVYYSFIEQGREGQVVSRNLYSSETQAVPAVLTPQWFAVGELANLFHLSTVLAYQLTRIAFAVLFLILAYKFIAGLLSVVRHRMVAMSVLATATGFGALVSIGNLDRAIQHLAIPVDTWVPEAFPFTSLYHNPLFLMGLCGILAVLLLAERAVDRQDGVAAWVASGVCLVLAIVHPYDVFVVAAVLVTTFFVRVLGDRQWTPVRARAYLRLLLTVLGPSVLALGIQRLNFALQPGLAGWGNQNVTLSPAVWWYLPAYLVPMLFAAFGIRRALHAATTRWFTVLAWAGVVPILVYLPHFPYQRRMLEGWFIALVALGAVGVQSVWAWLRPRLGATARAAVLGVAITTGIILTEVTSLHHLVQDSYFSSFGSQPTSIPSGVMDAFTWLRTETPTNAVVLAQPFTGNVLPGWAGRTVYYGHGDLTANSSAKIEQVRRFFTPANGFNATTFLHDAGITYVLVRADDPAGVAAVEQATMPLELAYTNADARIYRVR